MITDIAHESITALQLLPDSDVKVDMVNPDWSGQPIIYILTEPTKVEDMTQTELVSAETILKIICVAKDRRKTWDLARQAALAVYEKFEELEQTPQSGILCITLIEHNVFQIPERKEYQAFVSFCVLHKPIL